jgi:hypothetical protein
MEEEVMDSDEMGERKSNPPLNIVHDVIVDVTMSGEAAMLGVFGADDRVFV